MVAARLVRTKKGDNRFTVDAQICASTQSAVATALKVSRRIVQSARQGYVAPG